MRRGGLASLTALLILGLGTPLAGAPSSDPSELLGKAPWPGMTAWDVAWCRELVYRAVLVEIREPGQNPRTVRVTDARGWLKPNGFYGLRLNGQPIDEGWVWLAYAGTMTNLRVLFTYGSGPVGDGTYRD